MPDSVSAFDGLVEYPNTGLCSIAAQLDGCDVRVLDLIACRKRAGRCLAAQLEDFRPELVGMSAMTFQYDSAVRAARIVKEWNRTIPVVLGGYHATLMNEEIGLSPESILFDYLIRGEGEIAFPVLAEALKKGRPEGAPAGERGCSSGNDGLGAALSSIPNLSYKVVMRDEGSVGSGGGPGRPGKVGYIHNPAGPLADLARLRPPDRAARVYNDFRFFGIPFDTVETSRGCVKACSFCSITEMYGRTFRKFPLEMVVKQVEQIRGSGKKGVFFVDDNITLDRRWLKALCGALIERGLNDMHFIMQASVEGIAADPALPHLLGKAGFRLVFLGVESGNQRKLNLLHKGYSADMTKDAVAALRANRIAVVGGLIVGNPDDRPRDIREIFRFARESGLDHSIVQCLTPYPKTEIRRQLEAEGLITNAAGYGSYNGFIANVRTRHMGPLRIARETVRAGIPYYNSFRNLSGSLLWRYAHSSFLKFLRVNIQFIYSGWRNRMFRSTHRF